MGLIVLGIIIGWIMEWLFFNFYWKDTQTDASGSTADSTIEELNRKLAKKDKEISSLKSEISTIVAGVDKKSVKSVKKTTSSGSASKKASKVASFEKEMQNISGIGPKISNTLLTAGIDSYQKLAGMKVDELSEILSSSGTKYAMVDVSSWPKQASLLSKGDTAGFEKLLDSLKK